MYFTWMAREDELSPAALTLRAQSISPNDTGILLWDAFFPRANADSVKIRTISNLDFRPTTDRREWNQRGRLVDFRTPPAEEIEMTPIEGYFRLAEREMQELEERTMGQQDLFRSIVQPMIPQRVDRLAEGNYRRIELDAMTAWSLGQISAKNPHTGGVYTFDLGFDAARYQTVATAWSDPTVNAYDELLAWLEDSADMLGGMPQGVMLRLADLKTIQADAPNFFSLDSSLQMTRAQLQSRISDEIGGPFLFYVNEQSLDVYGDAGLAISREKVWPAGVLAAVPMGEIVGSTHFAPVARAFEISRAVPEAKIDVRGQTAYWETGNGGRELTVECQVNALPLPNEQLVSVIDIAP